MDFIENLELEHKWIGTAHSTLAQIAKSALSDKNLDHLATLLEVFDTYVLGLHFLKEEAVLFPEVLKLGLDQKGGPRCGDFVGRMQMWHYAADLIKLGKEEIKKEYCVHPTLRQVLGDRPSGVRIPLEEHRACYYSIELLKNRISQKSSPAALLKIIRLLLDLLADHREKEDTCLLVALRTSASPEVITKMSEELKNIESSFGTDQILMQQSRILELAEYYQVKLDHSPS